MARIEGVDLPRNKRIVIGLTYIFGIGLSTSEKILTNARVDFGRRVKDLLDDEITRIRQQILDLSVKTEGELRKEITLNIKRLIEIKSNRGMRHLLGLPVRGQRTHTNARTRKGPRRQAVASKKAPMKK